MSDKEAEFSVQCDWSGRIRIVLTPADTNLRPVEGKWADYRSIAVLQLDGNISPSGRTECYIAASAYGLLPKEEAVYQITALPTTLDHSMDHIDSQGVDRVLDPLLDD